MNDLLNTGSNALQAFRRAIATTSHNIANVNTEGYSRQRVLLEPVAPSRRSQGFAGNGVQITGVERMASELANARVLDASAAHARESVHHSLSSRLDNLVASDALALTPAFDGFFDAMQDASTDPSSSANRELVIAAGETLASRTGALQDELERTQGEVEDRRRASVDALNELATGLADVNRRIVNHRSSGAREASGDLLDQRDRLVGEMAAEIDVNAQLQDDGAMNVSFGNGVALVVGTRARALRTAPDPTHPGRLGIEVADGPGWQSVGARVRGGALGGLAAFEQGTLAPAMNRLGQIAQAFSSAVNAQHASGVDVDGNPGGTWFETGAPSSLAATANAGSASLDVAVTDAAALQASDYQAQFDGGSWRIVRESDGETTTANTLPTTLDGLEITVSGAPAAGDRFTVSATRHAAAGLRSVLGAPDALALSSPIRATGGLGNAGDARLESPRVIDRSDPALASPVRIEFTGATSYDVVDEASGNALASGVAYSGGNGGGDTIAFNGWEATLVGDASAGDVHRIEPASAGGGDNGNAMRLGELRSALGIGESADAGEAFGAMVAEIGGRTRSLETRSQALESLRDDALARRDSVSGVNLDEEAIDLARQEQAYQAAARIISTADELFQTILGVVR